MLARLIVTLKSYVSHLAPSRAAPKLHRQPLRDPVMEPFKPDYRSGFDLTDPELSERWDEVVADLHAQCPVARSEVGTLRQLTIGGIGTTGYGFSGGLHHLATRAEDRTCLVSDPSLIPQVLDEFLRLFLGVVNMARIVLRVGYEEFLKCIPDFSAGPDFVPEYETGSTRHMVRLPLKFDAARAAARDAGCPP